MSEFPAALQLELMEEDNMAYGAEDLPPDEQQLEVLEDIWLKAGEIEAEDAMICDAGYNVKKGRRYFQKKKRSGRDHNKPRRDRKKREESESRKEPGGSEDLTGLYAPCASKSKKVCGRIVAPIELDKQTLDTAELVKSLVAQETDMLLSHKKKHKHKEKDHEHKEHKRHKKRKHHSSDASSVSDSDPFKAEKSSPEVKEEIDSIIRAAAEEHEQSLLESSVDSSADETAKFEILPSASEPLPPPLSVARSTTSDLKSFRRPKEAKNVFKSKVQTIKTSKGIITVLEPNTIMNKPNEPSPATASAAKPKSNLYENAFLSFLSNQQQTPGKKEMKSYSRKGSGKPPVEIISIPPKKSATILTDIKIQSAVTGQAQNEAVATSTATCSAAPKVVVSPSLPRELTISPVAPKALPNNFNDVRISPIRAYAQREARPSPIATNDQRHSPNLPRDLKIYPSSSTQPRFSSPFAEAFDSLRTITKLERRLEMESVSQTKQMPHLSVPEPKNPHVEHEQMPMLDPHSPVVHPNGRQAATPLVPTPNIPVANPAPVVTNQTLLNVFSIKSTQPEKTDPPEQPVPVKRKPNLIWSSPKFYTVNQCPETTYHNNDRFYPMTQTPIKLDDNVEQKVVVEAIPSEMRNAITALEDEQLGGGGVGYDVRDKERKESSSSSSSSSCSSSDSESDSDTEDCKLQLSSDESSCYSPGGGSCTSDSSSDEDEPKKPTARRETHETVEDVTKNEMKENVDSNPKRRRNDPETPARKRGRKPKNGSQPPKKPNAKRSGRGKNGKRTVNRQPRIRPYLSEIILGVRKKGRPNKNVQHKFDAIKNIIKNFKERFEFAPARGRKPPQTGAQLSKYLAYKKASLTPLDCRVEVQDVLCRFSNDFQEYLKSGLTLFNVSSIPIAQSHPASRPGTNPGESHEPSGQQKKPSSKKNVGPVTQGDVVWAKHKNGRYYKAIVMDIKTESQMCVFFPEDQSFSKDIILSDIVDWEKIQKPTIGQRLQIRWVDGKVYDADYIGKLDYLVFTVLFEDESTSHLHREYIYALNEYIPKRIVSKLSYASDMKNRDHLYDRESPLPEKRPVKRKVFEADE